MVAETFADEQLKESSPQTLLRFGMGGGYGTVKNVDIYALSAEAVAC